MPILAELDALLQRGGTLLLPNQHGARLLQEELGHWRCQQRGVRVVEAARIHAIDLWLAELWQTLALHCAHPVFEKRLLNGAEETLLWQRVLDASPAAATLLNPSGTARQLREAQRLLQFWQVPLAAVRNYLPAVAQEPEQDQVLAWRWLQDFQLLCERQRCLSPSAALPALLTVLHERADAVKALLPAEMIWLDFDDPPPVYQGLHDTLQRLGVNITLRHFVAATPGVTVHAYADTAAECRAAAQWAGAIIDTVAGARVGIVCPNLQSLRPQLLRIFQQQLSSEQLYCSAAETLVDQPFMAAALQILTLHAPTTDSLRFCQLLRSPWLVAADEEADGRVMLEWRIRRRGELQVRLADVRDWCLQQDKPWYCPVLGRALLQAQQRKRSRQGLMEWMNEFTAAWQQLLNLDILTTGPLQPVHKAWDSWLDNCRQLAAQLGTLSREQAQTALYTVAQHCRLGNGNISAPVHLLAPVETAGLRFTHVHVLQMQAGTWPSDLNPNACLPWRLQQEYQMPAIDPNRELARARQQMQRLQENTETVLRFSYPAQVDDLPVLPNPLLAGLPKTVEEKHAIPADLHPALLQFSSGDLVTWEEAQHLPLAPDQQHQAPGAMLTAQALCPFRAFAMHRLHAQELPKLAYGLPPSATGELLHRVLQTFWQTLKDSRLLGTLDEASIDAQLQQAIDEPLRQMARKYPATLTPRLLQLERQRVLDLLKSWLDQEKQRAPFTVSMTEEALQWRYGNLLLNLRLDRVDSAANGCIVVDYKSGRLMKPYWQEERLQQPQLLLYQQALQAVAQTPVSGLLYAKVTLEKMGYDGITAHAEGFDKLTLAAQKGVAATCWEDLQAHWQQCLQNLAQEYLDGLVVVAPQFTHSCNYCHLDRLCRIAEARRLSEEDA
jgi:ATP-dependent helicase/nuclease subunit B